MKRSENRGNCVSDLPSLKDTGWSLQNTKDSARIHDGCGRAGCCPLCRLVAVGSIDNKSKLFASESWPVNQVWLSGPEKGLRKRKRHVKEWAIWISHDALDASCEQVVENYL